MTLDARQLAVLLSIAEHGSFSRAAQARNISQPALSVQIADMEAQLGVRVLDRGAHGATLTSYGEVLVRHARAVGDLLRRGAEEVRLRKLGIHGPLTIGSTPIGLIGLVPIALGRLRQRWPVLQATIVEDVDENLMARLRDGEIELAVSTVGVDTDVADVVEEKLMRDPLDLVMRPDEPLGEGGSASLADMDGAQWVLPAPGGAFRRQLEALFVTAGVPFPSRAITAGSIPVLKALLIHAGGVAILPRQTLTEECRNGALRTVRLAHPGAYRFIGLRRPVAAALSPLAMEFAALLREVAAELGSAPIPVMK